jgi:uncharacterized protein
MIPIDSRLQDDVKVAMKAGDKIRVSTLRQLRSQIQYEKLEAADSWSEESAAAVLLKAAKMRRESIAQFEQGNRQDLADRELAELRIIEEYLPEQMNPEELDLMIDEAIAETGASGISDMGTVMGRIMSKVKGRVDGRIVNEHVRGKLGGA